MRVVNVVIQGGQTAGGVRFRVYRNDNVNGGAADPSCWRLVSDLTCADESVPGASVWRAAGFEVKPGGFYTFLWCYPDGRPLSALFPEGLTAPEGVERMNFGEWYRWAQDAASSFARGATDAEQTS